MANRAMHHGRYHSKNISNVLKMTFIGYVLLKSRLYKKVAWHYFLLIIFHSCTLILGLSPH